MKYIKIKRRLSNKLIILLFIFILFSIFYLKPVKSLELNIENITYYKEYGINLAKTLSSESCETLNEEYQITLCYQGFGTGIASIYNIDKISDICESLNNTHTRSCYIGVGRYLFSNFEDLNIGLQECNQLLNKESCKFGLGFEKGRFIDNTNNVNELCSTINDDFFKRGCYTGFGRKLVRENLDAKEICNNIDSDYKEYCYKEKEETNFLLYLNYIIKTLIPILILLFPLFELFILYKIFRNKKLISFISKEIRILYLDIIKIINLLYNLINKLVFISLIFIDIFISLSNSLYLKQKTLIRTKLNDLDKRYKKKNLILTLSINLIIILLFILTINPGKYGIYFVAATIAPDCSTTNFDRRTEVDGLGKTWDVDCALNCTIEDVDLGLGELHLWVGPGTFTIRPDGNLTVSNVTTIADKCQLIVGDKAKHVIVPR